MRSSHAVAESRQLRRQRWWFPVDGVGRRRRQGRRSPAAEMEVVCRGTLMLSLKHSDLKSWSVLTLQVASLSRQLTIKGTLTSPLQNKQAHHGTSPNSEGWEYATYAGFSWWSIPGGDRSGIKKTLLNDTAVLFVTTQWWKTWIWNT